MSAGVKRTSTSTRPAFAAALLSLVLAAAPARAHPEPPSTLINRYVTLWASGARLDLQFTLLHGPLTAEQMRRQIDRDGDGRLSEAEVAEQTRALAGDASQLITVELDGRPLAPRWTGRLDLNGNPAVAAVPLVRELAAQAPLPPGEHRLVVRLGPPFPRLGDTEIALEAGDGWSLAASEPPAGVSALARQDRFQIPHGHGGEAPPRVAFIVRSGAGPRAGPGRLVLPLVALVIAAGLAAAWLARRRQRR